MIVLDDADTKYEVRPQAQRPGIASACVRRHGANGGGGGTATRNICHIRPWGNLNRIANKQYFFRKKTPKTKKKEPALRLKPELKVAKSSRLN
jgi:hypothetical protein